METSTSQQLCTLENPADGGESRSVENVDTNVAASDHQGGFTVSTDTGQKVQWF